MLLKMLNLIFHNNFSSVFFIFFFFFFDVVGDTFWKIYLIFHLFSCSKTSSEKTKKKKKLILFSPSRQQNTLQPNQLPWEGT